jgi:peptide/nickel transport system substrate-binding protein
MRVSRLAVAALATALLVAACAPRGATRTAAEGTIVVRSPQEPDGLNPCLSGMSASVDAYQPIFSGLLAVDDHMQFVPDLALEIPTEENHGVVSEGKGMAVT